MVVYRVVPARWSTEPFSGNGARLYGGRWNPKGYPAVYCAGSLALAILEIRVNQAQLDPDEQYLFLRSKFLMP